MAIGILLAREDFKKGDTGYATGYGVGRVPAGTIVRALEDVREGDHGKFEEVPQKSKPAITGGSN